MNRDEIIEAIGRNLFVQAYADFIEREFEGDEEVEDITDLPRPGPGEDWSDFAPETPAAASATALKAAESIERLNGCDLEALYSRATAACRAEPRGCEARTHTPEGFGSDLGMMLTGTGVSWFDDHANFPLKVPHVELHIFSLADLTAGEGDAGEVDERFF